MEPVLKSVATRGLNTAWLEAGPEQPGERPILLLLHGYPDAADSWSHQLAAFAETATVVAPYGRGAAPSDPGDRLSRYAPDAVALDSLAVLRAVDPSERRPVVVVGHDLGAVHAWHLARLLRGRVHALVVINGLTIGQMLRRFSDPRQLAKSWYIGLMQLPVVPELVAKRLPGRLLSLAHRLGGLPEAARPSLASVSGALAGPLNQYRAFLREAPRHLRHRERRLDCRLLVLWGADDGFLVPPTADELAADATNVTIRILPGNHWLHRSQPEQVNSLIGGLFAGVPPHGP